jgi:hypothetical protein
MAVENLAKAYGGYKQSGIGREFSLKECSTVSPSARM